MVDTPRTENALCKLRYYETRHGDRHEEELVYIEPEFARDLERELAAALKVVEAARAWNESICIRTGSELMKLVSEWEARHG